MVNFIRILGIFYLYLFTGFSKFAHIFFFIIVRFIVWGFLNKYSWSHLIDLCFELIAHAYDYLSRYLALHLPYLTGHTYVHSYLFVFNLNAQSIICITHRTSSTIDVFFFCYQVFIINHSWFVRLFTGYAKKYIYNLFYNWTTFLKGNKGSKHLQWDNH